MVEDADRDEDPAHLHRPNEVMNLMEGGPIQLEAGNRLSHYQLVEKLGAGGMGVVWRAHDTLLNRSVAIKLLNPELTRDASQREILIQEARAASTVNDPHIVQVYEIGQDKGIDFIVMEYVDAPTLTTLLRRRSLNPEEVTALGHQIARALARAHRHHLIHRDLKPANLLVSKDDEVKIVDFGLARVFAPRDQTATVEAPTELLGPNLDSPQRVAGTLPYMSPEQVRGESLDARSDIFSLGAILYEAATGKRSFSGHSNQDVAAKVVEASPVPPQQLVPTLPIDLVRIIGKAMARRPEDRYQSMDDLAVDCRRLHEELRSGSSPSYGDLQAGLRSGTSRRTVLALISVGVLALVLIGALLWPSPPSESALVVIPVVGATGDSVSDEAAWAISEAVAIRLAQSSDLHVVATPMSERLHSYAGDLKQLAMDSGARKLLRLELSRDGDDMLVRSVLIDASQNRILGGREFRHDHQDLSRIAVIVADQVLESQGYVTTQMYDYVVYVNGEPETMASDLWRQWQEVLAGHSTDTDQISARLVERFPEDPAVHAIHSMAVYMRWAGDQAPESRSRLDRILADMDRLDPHNPYSAIWQAIILRRQGHPREAIPILTRVLVRNDLTNSCRSWTHRMRGFALRETGDVRGAIDDARLALQLDPAHATNSYALAAALYDDGRLEEALAQSLTAQALSPSESRMLVLTAEILIRLDRPADAVLHTRRACDLGTEEGCAVHAVVLHLIGDLEGANQARQRALEAHPTKEGAYYLACHAVQRDDFEGAIELLSRSLSLGLADTRLETDPCFEPLASDKRFAGILEMVRARVE